MPSTRTPTRPAPASWRQWLRFTFAGFRLHPKRHPTALAIAAWLVLLILLYLLRLYATRTPIDPVFFRDRLLVFSAVPAGPHSTLLRDLFALSRASQPPEPPEPPSPAYVSALHDVLYHGQRDRSLSKRSNLYLSDVHALLAPLSRDLPFAHASPLFLPAFSDALLSVLPHLSKISIVSLTHSRLHHVAALVAEDPFSNPDHPLASSVYDVADIYPDERVVDDVNATDVLDRSLIYCADVWMRAKILRERVRDMHLQGRWNRVKFVDVPTSDLTTVSGIQSFLRTVGLDLHEEKAHQFLRQQVQQEQSSTSKSPSLSRVRQRMEALSKQVPILREVLTDPSS